MKDLAAVKILADEDMGYVNVIDSGLDDILRNIRGAKMQSAGKIASPLDTKIESVVPQKSRINYLFPTLVALIVMFVGLFLASSLEAREKTQKSAFKNMITPTSKLLFIFGNFITNMIVIILQLAVVFAVGMFFFAGQMMNVLLPLSVVLLLMAGLFVFLGMLIGTLFKNEETGVIAALSIGFLLLFFSSTILPVEALPALLKDIAAYNPFYASQFLLSKILLFGSGLYELRYSIFILGGWLLGLFVLVLISKNMIRSEQ